MDRLNARVTAIRDKAREALAAPEWICVPRAVAENLAAVIQGAHDGYLGVDDLANALAEYRRAYPKPEAP